MDYFDGLNIVITGNVPRHTRTIINSPEYYSIQFNYSGQFFLKVGSRKELTASGAYAFLTYPGEHFVYGSCAPDAKRHHCYICACGPKIEKYIESGLFELNPADPLVPISQADHFLHIIQQIIKLNSFSHSENPRKVLLFEELLLQMYEERKNKKHCMSAHMALLEELAEKISARPEEKYDFALYAAQCQVTMIHFRRLFKAYTGDAPQQFLIKNRLRKAAEILVSTRHSVKEAAFLAGWEDEYYFSRLFRKHYLISPTQYRRESIQN